jgi:hypothetical protein
MKNYGILATNGHIHKKMLGLLEIKKLTNDD